MDNHGRPTGRSAVGRLLTDREFLIRAARFGLGLPVPLHTEDRTVLEQRIFPHFLALPDTRCVLFVGVAWYTRHYEKAFFSNVHFWTIDIAQSARKFAGRKHITASLTELSAHFAQDYFDLIICNGVYGHGLNGRDDCERAFAACYECLRDGGRFVLGWNDTPEYSAAPLDSIRSLRRFGRESLAEFGGWRLRTDTPNRHTYDFYRKLAPSRASTGLS